MPSMDLAYPKTSSNCPEDNLTLHPDIQMFGGKPHEEADPETIYKPQRIFEPERSEADHEVELLKDRNSSSHPVFQDYGMFTAIMGESRTGETTDRSKADVA
ncbi:hypothetical protein GGR53DRAFT_463906 [Hypoxylon sp. FL1150]|nr:hypothetical protein GGR53DRAFT_463906 [Hypoxylon sp. FL1150]